MSNAAETNDPVRVVGRYALYGEIAAGGMATVHFGRLLGPVGFSRTVAIKRLHPQFAKDPEFVSMFLDEARLAARIRHPNVVPTLDVVATQGELFLVMDYVQGESLSRLIRASRDRHEPIPLRIVSGIMVGTLHGLHSAHEAKNERGEPLHIVHRDISPQNVLVGTDGVARVLDFGVAKAAGRVQTTREGQLKGKLAYMAPEQINGNVTRQTDVYAAAIVLWEALTAQRLFSGDNEAQILGKIIGGLIQPPSALVPGLPVGIDEVVLRGLAREPEHRYATAKEFANALERCAGLASASEIGEWVEGIAGVALHKRAERIAEIESSSANIRPGDVTQAGGPNLAPDPPVSQASQLSSISVSREAGLPKRGRLGVAAMAAAAGLVGLIVVLAFALHKSSPAATTANPVMGATSAPVIPPPPPLSAVVAAPPPTTSAAPAVQPVATLAPLPPHGWRRNSGTGAVTATATATVAAPVTTTVAAPAKNCDPPFTLDDKGHKIWKRECM